jgi:hypothetical protein
MDEHRQASRLPPAMHRRCSLGLLSFTHLEISDHIVRILDISSCGLGVESDEQMEPGLVWFHNRVGVHRGGILVWNKKQADRYLASIRFLSLAPEDERLLRYWPPCPGQLRSCMDLEDVISVWMKAAKNLPGDPIWSGGGRDEKADAAQFHDPGTVADQAQ